MEVAASIIAIVELSANVTVWCYHYVKDVSHASQEAASLGLELGGLQVALTRLQKPLISDEILEKLGPVLKNCRADLEYLSTKLKPQQGWTGKKDALLWPFRKRGEFRQTLDKIERYKSLFSLVMTGDLLKMTDGIRSVLQSTPHRG
jgi:hypothetical protein